MNNLPLLLIFMCLFSTGIYSQKSTTTTSLFFKSDRYDLPETEKTKLDSFITSIAGKPVKSIYIAGNADSDADSLYNIRLSENRTTTVREYLEKNGIDPALFSTAYFGENKPVATNDVEPGKQKNRRVDIIITFKPADTSPTQPVQEKPAEPIVNIEKQPVTTDTCLSDTTIVLPQGSRYSINVCDYRKYKNCIKITEYLTAESILNSNLTTLSASDEQLITGGMLDIKIGDSAKLTNPLIFRMPVVNFADLSCGEKPMPRNMLLWEQDKNGRWTKSRKVAMVNENDSVFYQFTTTRSVNVNLDWKPPVLPVVKTQLRAAGNIKLVSVRMFYNQSIYQVNPEGKNKANLDLNGCSRGVCNCIMVKVVGINSQGDTLISRKCLNDYKKKILFARCKQPVNSKRRNRLWGIIPVRAGFVYRKHIIRPRDWNIVGLPKAN